MKKKVSLALIIFLIPIKVLASGNINVSTTNINLIEGEASSCKINANNSAGRVDVSSNSSCVTVDKNSVWLDNNSTTVTVKSNFPCQANITVSIVTAATYDEEVLSGSYNIKVTVNKKTTTTKTTTTTRITTTKHIETTKKTQTQTTTPIDKNIYLNDLSLDKYDLNFIKNQTLYEIKVKNNISSINIMAQADELIKIEGIGQKELKEGENIFNIELKDNNGNQNTYILKINREEKEEKIFNTYDSVKNYIQKYNGDIIINLNKNTDELKCKKEILDLIKNKDRKIIYNIINNNKIEYSFIFEGKIINNYNKDIKLKINITKNSKKYKNVFNKDYLILNFEQHYSFPNSTKLKFYINNNDKDVNIYEDSNNIKLIYENLKPENNYVIFPINKTTTYIITSSKITSISNTFLLKIMPILITIEIIIIGFIILKNKKNIFNNN